jgi:hypothetical protein
VLDCLPHRMDKLDSAPHKRRPVPQGHRPRSRQSDIFAIWDWADAHPDAGPAEAARAFPQGRRQTVGRYVVAFQWLKDHPDGGLPAKLLDYGVDAGTIRRLQPLFARWRARREPAAATLQAPQSAEPRVVEPPTVHARFVLGIAGDLANLLDPFAPPTGSIRPVRPSTIAWLVSEELAMLALRKASEADGPWIAGKEPSHLWSMTRREERALRAHTAGHPVWDLLDKEWVEVRSEFAKAFWSWLMNLLATATRESRLPLVVPQGTAQVGERILPPGPGLLPEFCSTVAELASRPHLRRIGVHQRPDTFAFIGRDPDTGWVTATVPLRLFSGRLPAGRCPFPRMWDVAVGPGALLGFADPEGHSVEVDIAYCPDQEIARLLQDLHPRLVQAVRQDAATERVCHLWAQDAACRDRCVALLRGLTANDVRKGRCDYAGCDG